MSYIPSDEKDYGVLLCCAKLWMFSIKILLSCFNHIGTMKRISSIYHLLKEIDDCRQFLSLFMGTAPLNSIQELYGESVYSTVLVGSVD